MKPLLMPHLKPAGKPLISVIIPALNEAAKLAETFSIARSKALVAHPDPPPIQYILADGGSTDGTPHLARSLNLEVISSQPGRARQMNAGAALAKADILLFLHADTWLPPGWPALAIQILARPKTIAGAFRFALFNPSPGLKIIEYTTAFRCLAFSSPYGDQAIFLKKSVFNRAGGWPEMFMEDLELMARLKKLGRIRLAPAPARTSARKWQTTGPLRLTAIHQLMVLGHLLGIANPTLERLYKRWVRKK